MDKIAKTYSDAFKQHGDSPASVLWPKGRQEERFRELTKHIPSRESFSILDFGCGLAHLKNFLDKNFSNVKYTGVEMVEDFLLHNREKYPDSVFLNPSEFEKSDETFDYVISSGAFNMLYEPSTKAHERKVLSILQDLFNKTNIALSVDFMTDMVDFKQEGSYHANPSFILEHFLKHLSRRTILNHAYMPYEFCITAFKNTIIKRPENIYE